MCETELKVAVDGVTQWSPDVTATVYDNGDTVILARVLGVAVFVKILLPSFGSV